MLSLSITLAAGFPAAMCDTMLDYFSGLMGAGKSERTATAYACRLRWLVDFTMTTTDIDAVCGMSWENFQAIRERALAGGVSLSTWRQTMSALRSLKDHIASRTHVEDIQLELDFDCTTTSSQGHNPAGAQGEAGDAQPKAHEEMAAPPAIIGATLAGEVTASTETIVERNRDCLCEHGRDQANEDSATLAKRDILSATDPPVRSHRFANDPTRRITGKGDPDCNRRLRLGFTVDVTGIHIRRPRRRTTKLLRPSAGRTVPSLRKGKHEHIGASPKCSQHDKASVAVLPVLRSQRN